jgi:alkylated DNA nucleotide flippase Atl1
MGRGSARSISLISGVFSYAYSVSLFKKAKDSCNIVWNRVVNAAKNIFDVFMFAAEQEKQRHPAFERPKEQA